MAAVKLPDGQELELPVLQVTSAHSSIRQIMFRQLSRCAILYVGHRRKQVPGRSKASTHVCAATHALHCHAKITASVTLWPCYHMLGYVVAEFLLSCRRTGICTFDPGFTSTGMHVHVSLGHVI